ncbi:MAG: hypothetical protein ACI94Y_003652 [Maribacter sp.]
MNKVALKEKIIADFNSNDVEKTLQASKIVIGLDNLNFTNEEVATIKKQAKSLPQSDICITRDYRIDVKKAVHFLELFDSGMLCKCNLYGTLTPPEKEIEFGFLTLNKPIFINKKEYQSEYNLSCPVCKIDWEVHEVMGYHYPWYRWINKAEQAGRDTT